MSEDFEIYLDEDIGLMIHNVLVRNSMVVETDWDRMGHENREPFIDAANEVRRHLVPAWVVEVMEERANQDTTWGTVKANPHSYPEWVSILAKQFGQVAQCANAAEWNRMDPVHLRVELVQMIAVGVAMLDQMEIDPAAPER